MSSVPMIFKREITPGTIRRGIVVASCSIPSTRNRTRMSLPCGSKCTSDACSSTACAMTLLTSLMTGAFCADSRMSGASIDSSSTSSAIASATAESNLLSRAMTAATSSGEATAGRTSRPVMIEMSSTARTLVGSVMATSSVSWSMNATGTASNRFAVWSGTRFTAPRSTSNRLRSRWSRPKRSAVARASWCESMLPPASKHLLGGHARVAALLDRALDLLARRVSELDDVVGDESPGAAAPGGRRQPLGASRRRPGPIGRVRTDVIGLEHIQPFVRGNARCVVGPRQLHFVLGTVEGVEVRRNGPQCPRHACSPIGAVLHASSPQPGQAAPSRAQNWQLPDAQECRCRQHR